MHLLCHTARLSASYYLPLYSYTIHTTQRPYTVHRARTTKPYASTLPIPQPRFPFAFNHLQSILNVTPLRLSSSMPYPSIEYLDKGDI